MIIRKGCGLQFLSIGKVVGRGKLEPLQKKGKIENIPQHKMKKEIYNDIELKNK